MRGGFAASRRRAIWLLFLARCEFSRLDGRSHRREKMRVLGADAGRFFEVECQAEPFGELGDVLERAAEKHHRAPQGATACQTAERLAHNGRQRARRNIFLADAGRQQRADVGLREHRASRGYGVLVSRALGQLIHLGRPHAEHAGHCVDESTRTACTRGVHALLEPARKVNHLGVFASELDDCVCTRIAFPNGGRRGDYLLNERQLQPLGHGDASRSGDGDRSF